MGPQNHDVTSPRRCPSDSPASMALPMPPALGALRASAPLPSSAVPHLDEEIPLMPHVVDRRAFLKRTGSTALAVVAAPLVGPSPAIASTERLAVAVGQWGTETPLPWRNTQLRGAREPLRAARRPGRARRDGGSGPRLAITGATTKKVGPWQTLAYTVAETNYEYIS
jgi:hypothetical protein